MNSAEKGAVLHCLKSMIDEEVCEECPLYGTTGTDHCEEDCVRLAINALEQEPCDDCISRQAVIEVIKKSHCEEWVKAEIGAPIEALSPVTPAQKWIPVSERLPKAGEYIGDVPKYYLVQNEFGDMMVARYRHSEYWEQIYQLKPIGDEIVAWMPLPEPYRVSPTGAEGSDKE